jgi:type IV pilus assembly protein PilA
MKIFVECNYSIYYNFHNSRLSNANNADQLEARPTAKTHTHTMKNIKVNTSRKSGFSLVEMLVVIAIIGIIAAIAIPNIGNLNDSAKTATARRNAQTVASVLNAAIAAGASLGSPADSAALVTLAIGGVSPSTGAFAGKTFTSGAINPTEQAAASKYLSWDPDNKQVKYDPGSY